MVHPEIAGREQGLYTILIIAQCYHDFVSGFSELGQTESFLIWFSYSKMRYTVHQIPSLRPVRTHN